jgi:hypothetical protein
MVVSFRFAQVPPEMRVRRRGESFEVDLGRVSLAVELERPPVKLARRELELPPTAAQLVKAVGGQVQHAPPVERQRVELEVVHAPSVERVRPIGIGDYA